MVKIGHVFPDISSLTDRQTDRQTNKQTDNDTPFLYQGAVKNVHTLVAALSSPAGRAVAEAFTSHAVTRHSIVASANLAALVAVVTRCARRLTGVAVIARLTLAPAVLTRQHHQH